MLTNLAAMPAQRLKQEGDHVAENLKKPWEQLSAEMAASKGEMVGGYVRSWRADKRVRIRESARPRGFRSQNGI